jgi:hypothetical protein
MYACKQGLQNDAGKRASEQAALFAHSHCLFADSHTPFARQARRMHTSNAENNDRRSSNNHAAAEPGGGHDHRVGIMLARSLVDGEFMI